MPKNPLTQTLKRWKAMDRALARNGLHLETFAAKWGVTVKTVRRDLKVFKENGQQVRSYRETDQNGGYRWEWKYTNDEPLFYASMLHLFQTWMGDHVPKSLISWERWCVLIKTFRDKKISFFTLQMAANSGRLKSILDEI